MTTTMRLPRVAEYGDIDPANMSETTILADANVHNAEYKYDRRYWFTHKSTGFEPAGSMARWTNEKWCIEFVLNNQRHARAFNTLRRAQSEWNKLTA